MTATVTGLRLGVQGAGRGDNYVAAALDKNATLTELGSGRQRRCSMRAVACGGPRQARDTLAGLTLCGNESRTQTFAAALDKNATVKSLRPHRNNSGAQGALRL
jgi:hypothetical protein